MEAEIAKIRTGTERLLISSDVSSIDDYTKLSQILGGAIMDFPELCREKFLGTAPRLPAPHPKPQGDQIKQYFHVRPDFELYLLLLLELDAFLRPATYQSKSINVEYKRY